MKDWFNKVYLWLVLTEHAGIVIILIQILERLFYSLSFVFFSTLYHPVGQLMVKTDLKMTCGLWMDSKPLYLIFFWKCAGEVEIGELKVLCCNFVNISVL